MLIMKKNSYPTNTQKNVTIAFGYGLFLLTLLAITVSTVIPWTTLLFDPATIHLNVALFLVSLVAGAVLPAVVSYLLGDRAPHTKNKTSHHYNGVLFGIAAYWLSLLFSFIGAGVVQTVRDHFSEPLASIILMWPALVTILVMGFVAIGYARKQNKNTSVLQHRPYQIILLGSIISFLAYVAANQGYGTDRTIVAFGIISLIVPIVLTAVSYTMLSGRRLARSATLASAAIAMSMGGIAASLSGQLISYQNESFVTSMFICQFIGLIVWIVYLWLMTRE